MRLLKHAKQAQLPKSVFTGMVLQPSDSLSWPHSDPFQKLHIIPALGAPNQDAELQMGPYKAE